MGLKLAERMHDVWVNVLCALGLVVQNNITDHLNDLLEPRLRKYTTGLRATNDLGILLT